MATLYLTKKDAELSEINPGSPRFKLMPGVVICHNITVKRYNHSLLQDQAFRILYQQNIILYFNIIVVML